MRYARLTATLAFITLIVGIVVLVNVNHTPTQEVQLASAEQVHGDPLSGWKRLSEGIAESARQKAAAEAAAAAEAQRQQELAARQAEAQKVARTRQTQRQTARVQGANNGDFMSCVREHESGNNYADRRSSKYHGAYNMTTQHWGGRGGYTDPADAPPEMQDQKFREDMAQGAGYMHQQYPTTSRMCGM